MSEYDNDPSLQDAELSALYRQLPPDAPDREIDAAIRTAAHRAVRAGFFKWNRTPGHHGGWFALAAVALLCVGLVMQMRREFPGEFPQEFSRQAPEAMKPVLEAEPQSANVPAESTAARQRESTADKVLADVPNKRVQKEVADKDVATTSSNEIQQAPIVAPAAPPVPLAATAAGATAKMRSETITQRLDHDIQRQLEQPDATPDCASHPNGDQQLLCDLLILRAANKPLPADWQQQLDAAGLWQDDFAYRRPLLEKLFR